MTSVRSLILVLLVSSYGSTEKVFKIGKSGQEYTLEIFHDSYIVIQCATNGINVEELPRSVASEITYLTIEHCELPKESLQDVVEALGARNTTYVKLIGVPLIKREHFALVSVEDIYIRNSVMESDALGQQLGAKFIDLYNTNINLTETSFAGLTSLDMLVLNKCHIARLPQSIFKATPQLRKLELPKNLITEVTNSNFEGLGSLEVLDLSENQLSSLPDDFLHFLTTLKKLYLDKNPLIELTTNALKGSNLLILNINDNTVPLTLAPRALAQMTRLTYATFRNCSITTLPANLVEGSNAIDALDLSNNHIKNIPKNFFENLNNMYSLDLENNQLSVLSSDTFAHLTNLRVLYLSYNTIDVITAGTFSFMDKLANLQMTNNGLRVVSPQAFPASIEQLDLRNNELITLETTLMPALHKLDLSHNSLSSLPLFWRNIFPALTDIDLTHNEFTQLTESDFIALPSNCRKLNLSYNKIISIHIRKNTTLPQHLWLTDAPLRCDCHLHTFSTLFENNRADTSAICAEPVSFEGRHLMNVIEEEFICPMEFCPNSCTCVIRPETKALEVECRKQAQLTAAQVTELEFHRRQHYSDMTLNTTVKYDTY